MIKKMPIAILTLCVSLSGCAKDQSLAPPPDGESITVTVKVPKELVAETLQVMYRSTLCTFTDHSAFGEAYQRDGYQRTDLQLVREGQSDRYVAKLPIDGGGACQWRLSNVTFGVAYGHPTNFGENVTYGAGGGVVVIFDHNNSPRGGADIKVEGDLTIRKDYYPWVKESFLGGYRKRVSLAGEGDIYVMYQALQARQVYFEPVLHSGFLVTSVQPKVKKKGNHTSFTYPDGSVVTDGRSKPDFRKLQAIRQAAESKQ
ncbi:MULTISPECIES: hypothetical protein [Pseudomonas]|uniref:Lipoprotein n=1 Tax=Pseudomonas monachiensis TaxID=3060212 RepID=A0ABW9H532_9PSED|nr:MULTISPECIES: hypothetical protein [unclassified Pseudomonas]KRA94432.1 hypothetical protein ASD91_11150 [Pseudomonas sp. Root68]KRB66020.1 hypothetical protein ASD95_10455 [Pseudomonas sp. Root71]